jgi:hypothetical protein
MEDSCLDKHLQKHHRNSQLADGCATPNKVEFGDHSYYFLLNLSAVATTKGAIRR